MVLTAVISSFPQAGGVFSDRCRFHKPMAFSATAVVSTKRWRFQQPLSFPQNGCVLSNRCRFHKTVAFLAAVVVFRNHCRSHRERRCRTSKSLINDSMELAEVWLHTSLQSFVAVIKLNFKINIQHAFFSKNAHGNVVCQRQRFGPTLSFV